MNKVSQFWSEVWVFQIEVSVKKEMMQILDLEAKTLALKDLALKLWTNTLVFFSFFCLSVRRTCNLWFSCCWKLFWTVITNRVLKMNMTDAYRKRFHIRHIVVVFFLSWNGSVGYENKQKKTVVKYLILTTENNSQTVFAKCTFFPQIKLETLDTTFALVYPTGLN